ncbi:inositol-3-phosphate synthase [Methylobacterium oryzihabitans]|uniref:Inositol-3-phosphate synthase n=1 Tax=Methylobacterium oryzihabitans TaxID=2499852 RepID=A0A437PEK1_9HYPH|nr:inositol-3-phosphate synthase [Methylobacterium oryzihabitans]RVU20534.1 inositol-3-phosphate synthase [Methylobacterium oryzihabitans]
MSRKSIRVGLVGVGNCASSFVQGLHHYRDARSNEAVPGLMNVALGGYHVGDVEIASAFDIAAAKVGRDLADAILAPPNNTEIFARVPESGIVVRRGPTLDGLGRYLRDEIPESEAPEADVTAELRRTGTEVLVSYLPVGSQRATEFYAERALEAGCAFVNCIPVFIASDPSWRRRFEERRLPLVGDDIKSQVGATIVHRVLANLLRERGVRLDRTYQLNFGGNADFKNMLERERLESKKLSKTRAVTSQLDGILDPDDIHVGPSDHVPWLTDRKWAHIRLEGTAFGGVPLNLELKLEVWDSPNSAGIVIDAVRCARLGLDRGLGGALVGPSSYFMKSPPVQFTDGEARAHTLRFIDGEPDLAAAEVA